jgi:tetratricopeptide (TPR) repeat protein
VAIGVLTSTLAAGSAGDDVVKRADELLGASQAAQAEVLLQEALAKAGPDPQPGGAASVEVLLRLGTAQSLQSKYVESEATFRAALELAPREPRVPQNLGLLFLRQERYDDAIQYFQRALEVRPGNPESNFYIGRIHERRGNPEEALRSYIAELNVNPANGNAWRYYWLLRRGERAGKRPFPWDMLAIWLVVVVVSATLYWLKRTYWDLQSSPGFRQEPEGPEFPGSAEKQREE